MTAEQSETVNGLQNNDTRVSLLTSVEKTKKQQQSRVCVAFISDPDTADVTHDNNKIVMCVRFLPVCSSSAQQLGLYRT